MGKDVLIGQDFDLLIDDGDFVIDEDLQQRICCILSAAKGHYKQWPILGGNLRAQLHGPFGQQSLQDIQLQLEVDNIKTQSITYKDGELLINANSKI